MTLEDLKAASYTASPERPSHGPCVHDPCGLLESCGICEGRTAVITSHRSWGMDHILNLETGEQIPLKPKRQK